jgi:hypothetical protein
MGVVKKKISSRGWVSFEGPGSATRLDSIEVSVTVLNILVQRVEFVRSNTCESCYCGTTL